MPTQSPKNVTDESGTLRGWKEIASHLGVTVRTAQSWEKERGLPVRRVPGKRGMVYCSVAEADAWMALGRRPVGEDTEPKSKHRAFILAAVASLVAVGGLAWMLDEVTEPPSLLEAAPLTSFREYEGRADLSPDASHVALLVREQSGTSVHVLNLLDQSRRVLAADALEESAVRWSPSADSLAYVRRGESGLEIVAIEPVAGTSHLLAALPGADRATNLIDNAVFDWGPPGLAVSAREDSGPFFIAVVSPEGGAVRRLTTPPESYAGDTMPAFSMDGRSVAYARFSSLSECELYVMDLESGREQRLTNGNTRIWGFDWLPDGSIVYASNEGLGHPRLYMVDPQGNRSASLTGPEYIAHFPTVAVDPAGQTILIYQRKERWNRIRFARADSNAAPESIIESTWTEAWPDLSPDGERLTFTSTRSGATEVWIAPAAGGGDAAIRLTHQDGPYSDMPRWSPDGTKISFTSADEAGNRDVYLIDVATRRTSRFTTEPSEEGRASWSRDGRWIYFRSDRSGSHQIWKQRVDGLSPAVQVTTQGGYEAFESFDGEDLYYIRSRVEDQLWAAHTSGGRESMVLTGPRESRWRIAANGVVFQQDSNLILWDPSKDATSIIYRIPAGQEPAYGFTATPDLNSFWWSQTDRNSSDLWMASFP